MRRQALALGLGEVFDRVAHGPTKLPREPASDQAGAGSAAALGLDARLGGRATLRRSSRRGAHDHGRGEDEDDEPATQAGMAQRRP